MKSKIFTKREMEILNLYINEELTNNLIAQKLFVSVKTVENHKNNMLLKANVKSQVGLIKYVINNNIL